MVHSFFFIEFWPLIIRHPLLTSIWICLEIWFSYLSLFRLLFISILKNVFCTQNYSFCTYLSYILPCIWLQFLFVNVDHHKFFYNHDLWGGGSKVWSHFVQWQNIAVNHCGRYMAEVSPIRRKIVSIQ